MESMNSQDAALLDAEDEINHMHIATIAVFEGPAPSADEIERIISARLDRVPRYRQRVRFVPFDLGPPVWIDDDRFDLNYHIRSTALPQPGSDDQLHTVVGRVMSRTLDRTRPLWEVWIIEGLAEGRWALLSKTHHCLVAQRSDLDLLSVLLDAAPDVAPRSAEPWEPEPRSSGFRLMANSVVQGLTRPRSGWVAFGQVARAPRRALHELAKFSDGLSSFRTFSNSSLEDALNGPIGAHRRWRSVRATLADLDKIGAAHGGTLDDVVLAVIAQGFRMLLRSRGISLDGRSVRSFAPFPEREDEGRRAFSGEGFATIVELPTAVEDPRERLAAVRRATDELKKRHEPSTPEPAVRSPHFSSPAHLAHDARRFARLAQREVQTVTTNVPGPSQPLFVAQRRMLFAYPFMPLAASVRIGVATFSYAGNLGFGVTADYESASDIDVLAAGIETGIAELLETS